MSTTATTAKTASKSRMVVLRLPQDKLSQFPSESKRPAINDDNSPSIQLPETADKSSESNATPVPATANDAAPADGSSLAPPKIDGRKKRGGAAAGGRKRAPPSIDPNAPPRERGRPGPKKKPRLADGTIDRSGEKGPNGNAVPAHKLGPKANTGAINAGLRALDRTGKPCRKWTKKGLQLKSFTGTVWSMPSWKAPTRNEGFAGDVKSDSTGSSEVKPVNESSAVASERSHSHVGETTVGGDTTMMNGIESSPAPPVAA